MTYKQGIYPRVARAAATTIARRWRTYYKKPLKVKYAARKNYRNKAGTHYWWNQYKKPKQYAQRGAQRYTKANNRRNIAGARYSAPRPFMVATFVKRLGVNCKSISNLTYQI